MKTYALTLTGVAMLLLATGTAHAADRKLPKEYLGRWCLDSSAVNGGGLPRTEIYTHERCAEPIAIYKDWDVGDITIRPYSITFNFSNSHDTCKVVKRKANVITYRCKDRKVTAEMNGGGDDSLAVEFRFKP